MAGFEAQLRVEPTRVKAKAGDIGNDINGMRTFLDAIEKEVLGTKAYWEGNAGTEERKNFADLVKGCRDLLTHFDEYPVKILKMAGVYEEAESDNKITVKQIKPDIRMLV